MKILNKCLNEETIQKLVNDIASGLEYLHKNKIIHRDIKLENLIINFNDISNKTKGLTEEDIYQKKIVYSSLNKNNTNEVGNLLKENITVKICDFGFSRQVDENNQASTILGTPITTAPDVLFLETGQGHYGTEADMWSLGICVYELLIGNVPFLKNTPKKLKEDILNGVFDYPKNVDISFESISFINSLLQYDPKKRLSWDKFWKHPFLKKNVKEFHPLKLTLDLDKNLSDQLENFKVNSKNNNNFLWMVYKDGAEVGIELDKIDENFMKMKFNENYFNDGEKGENDKEEKDYTNYSFIDINAKDDKEDILGQGFEVYKNFVEATKNDWEIISQNSEED